MTTITESICVAWALASLTLTAPAQTPAANLTYDSIPTMK